MTGALQQRINNARLVLYGVERGWVQFPRPDTYQHQEKVTPRQRRRRTRVWQARLRAERKGKDTSKFPPRIRRKRKQT